jgi:hypothetical protein
MGMFFGIGFGVAAVDGTVWTGQFGPRVLPSGEPSWEWQCIYHGSIVSCV